jgi:molybdate/tungstate transport system ATP-binding protein
MIEVVNLSIQAGEFRVDDVSFTVPTSQYAVLMGRTGSGKTTILEAICGLKHVRSGAIRLGGTDVTSLRPAERGIGFVPQDAALFDSMTVADHLDFALRIRHWSRRERIARVAEVAAMVGVEHLLERRPLGLSGGERQQVALGRAISFQPAILCLDEPLSALDDDSRDEMIQLIKRIQQETGVTALHVTHNRHEAESLADVRFQLEDGRVTRNGDE